MRYSFSLTRLINNKIIIIIFFALIIRIVIIILAHPWDNPVLLKDNQHFNKMALSFVNNFDFSYGIENWTSDKYTPGYPLFIAIIYLIFGAKIWIVPVFQVILDVGSVLIVYLISKELFKANKIPLISAILYSISIPSIIYTQKLYNETLFVFFFVLAILLFIQAVNTNKIWKFALVGLCIGFGTLIRPVLLYFPFVILIILLFIKNKPIRKVYFITTMFIVFFITLSPWQMRNLYTYGHYSLTFHSGFHLSSFNVTIVKANLENKSSKEVKRNFLASVKNVKNPYDKSKILKKTAYEYIQNHPLEYLKFHIKGIAVMFLSTAESDLMDLFGMKSKKVEVRKSPLSEGLFNRIYRKAKDGYFLILVSKNLLEYSFFLIGLFLMYINYRDKRVYLILFLLIIFYFANITGVVGTLRYKVPIIPIYQIISAVGIYEIFKSGSNSLEKNMSYNSQH